MKIQAISPMMSTVSAQPIKPISFNRESAQQEFLKTQTFGEESDIYTPSDPETLEQKYDIACRLAAFYKHQYESLAKNGNCIA